MKNILILLFFICTINLFQSSKKNQYIKVTYTKAYKHHLDTTTNAPKFMKNMDYLLLCDKNESRFEYIPRMSNDGEKINERFVGKGGGSGVYYKNLNEKIKLKVKTLFSENFLIQEEFNQYDWVLHKESKKILEYDCYKATGTYEEYLPYYKKNVTIKIIAWYTPELPVQFGPSGYDGLPGLVLQANMGSFYFIASKIEFPKDLKINKPTEGKLISRKEYNKISFELIKNNIPKE